MCSSDLGLDPPCFGGGVYTILSLYKNFIVKIKEKLKKDKLDARSLQQCTELSEEYKDNFLFQEILSYIMRDSKREELALHSLDIIAKRFTSKQEAEILFSQADPKLLVQMISSMVSVFTLEELFELITKERIPLFIELCAKLVKDFAVEEAYVLFHKKYPS